MSKSSSKVRLVYHGKRERFFPDVGPLSPDQEFTVDEGLGRRLLKTSKFFHKAATSAETKESD